MCAVTRNWDFFLTLAESGRYEGFHDKVESPTDSSHGFYDAAATAWMRFAVSGVPIRNCRLSSRGGWAAAGAAL